MQTPTNLIVVIDPLPSTADGRVEEKGSNETCKVPRLKVHSV